MIKRIPIPHHRGRPPMAACKRLSVLVSFACTPLDMEQLCKLARKEQISVSAFIRLKLKELGIFATD